MKNLNTLLLHILSSVLLLSCPRHSADEEIFILSEALSWLNKVLSSYFYVSLYQHTLLLFDCAYIYILAIYLEYYISHQSDFTLFSFIHCQF